MIENVVDCKRMLMENHLLSMFVQQGLDIIVCNCSNHLLQFQNRKSSLNHKSTLNVIRKSILLLNVQLVFFFNIVILENSRMHFSKILGPLLYHAVIIRGKSKQGMLCHIVILILLLSAWYSNELEKNKKFGVVTFLHLRPFQYK